MARRENDADFPTTKLTLVMQNLSATPPLIWSLLPCMCIWFSMSLIQSIWLHSILLYQPLDKRAMQGSDAIQKMKTTKC